MALIKAGVKVTMSIAIIEKDTGKIIMPHTQFEHTVHPEQFFYGNDQVLQIRCICMVKIKFVQELCKQIKESPSLSKQIGDDNWCVDDIFISKEILD